VAVLLDTDFLVSFWNPAEQRHAEADAFFEELVTGRHGRLYVTDFLVDEAATLALRRARDPRQAVAFLRFLLGDPPPPRVLALLRVGPDLFRAATVLFARLAPRRLSFTDCTSIEVVREHRLDALVTFDSGFSGLVPTLP